jgi:hypothetical protein
MSYHPQIADDTLFWISTAPPSTAEQGTPQSSSSPVVATPQTSTSIVPRIDTAYYAPPLDASVRGQVYMQPIDGDILTPPLALTGVGQAYSLQIGADFALWQNDKGYEMYDVQAQGNVSVGSDLNDAALLAVNGSTAVWVKNIAGLNATATAAGLPTSVHIFAFNWPK